jgi:hypothetical protein
MRALDPRIHRKIKHRFNMMDCRVKPATTMIAKACGARMADRLASRAWLTNGRMRCRTGPMDS